MALKLRIFGSLSLIVVSVMIWDCMGIIPIRDLNRRKGRKSRPVNRCSFGNKNFTIGDEWNPHLKPNGINYCITCRCKKDGLVDCEETKCKPITCPGKLLPSGKCCAVCPSPRNGVSLSNNQCHYNGKSYQQGEVWNIPMEKEIGNNNCAECTCHNGRASCAIRICPKLKCATIMQVKGRDSCCMQCRGFPLMPIGGLFQFRPAVTVQGSCYDKGRYYKNKDMWNPLASPSQSKAFQRPNCDLCVCQNTAVNCKAVLCSKMKCANPIQKNTNDCCNSCPDKQLVVSITNRTILQNTTLKKPADLRFPDCKFLSTIYKHNSSWTPRIPGHDPNSCVRCTCEFSRIKCDRNGCMNKTICRGKSCSNTRGIKPSTRHTTDKRLCSSGDRIEVYLFVNENSKRIRAKQNYIARIAVIKPKESFVNVHFWDVADNRATIKSSKPRKVRFERRKTNYVKIGETKIGRINRFLNKEKTLEKCSRKCKSKARDFINILKNRVRYLKTSSCRSIELFRSLKPRLS